LLEEAYNHGRQNEEKEEKKTLDEKSLFSTVRGEASSLGISRHPIDPSGIQRQTGGTRDMRGK